jgi:hypothetical protein
MLGTKHFQELAGHTRLGLLIAFFQGPARHACSEIPQTRILSVDVMIFPEMRESLDHLHSRSNFAAMSEFVPENKIHQTWAVEENALLLDLYRRYGPKWKFLITFMTDRSISEIKSRWHAILKKHIDVILRNTKKRTNVRSNIKEQPLRR